MNANVEHGTLRHAAAEVGVRISVSRNGTSFTLRTEGYPPKYGRRSQGIKNKNGTLRRVLGAVCWHGHRDFFRALFRVAPDAVVKTALATYRGADDFEAKYQATYGQGNGYNVAYGQACDCDDTADRLIHAPLTAMRQIDILACPHFIMVPEHYRPDGTCRCNDADHTVMREWGYAWKGGRWT